MNLGLEYSWNIDNTSIKIREERKNIIDRKFPSDNTTIIQIYTVLTYKEQYILKSVGPPMSLRGASSGSK